MSIQDRLAAKAASNNAGNESAEEVIVASTEASLKAGSAPVATQEEPVVANEFPDAVEQIAESTIDFKPSKGDYKNIRCHSIVTPKGKAIKPNVFGYYTDLPKEAIALAEFYVEKGLLEAVE